MENKMTLSLLNNVIIRQQVSKRFPYMLYNDIYIRLYETIDKALLGYRLALMNDMTVTLIRTDQYVRT